MLFKLKLSQSMIIDHLGFAISNVVKSKSFYSKVLAPLNIEFIVEVDDGWVGFGPKGGQKAELWFGEDEAAHAPMHIAFSAKTRSQVDEFYKAALAEGAHCNGEPGIRGIYHADYYGAFVIDPDGHNIEAVCHLPE